MNRIALVRTTFGDRARAEQVARRLVNERLAACVTIEQVHSIYRWQGEIEQTDEVAALFKVRAEDTWAVRARIAELHDYALPMIEHWMVETTPQGTDWVHDSTER